MSHHALGDGDVVAGIGKYVVVLHTVVIAFLTVYGYQHHIQLFKAQPAKKITVYM